MHSPADSAAGVAAESAAIVPAARRDLVIEPPDEGAASVRVVDPLLGQQFRLQPDAVALLALLDEPQPFERLAAAYAEVTAAGAAPGALRVTLDRFSRLLLLDDARSRAARAVVESTEAWRQASPAEVPLVLLPEARFRCTCCGGCCGGHNIGPVRQALARELRDSPLARERVQALGPPKELFFTRQLGDHEMLLCQARDRSCVFLDETQLCRIHAELGGAAKPSPCQLFPFTFVARPDGIAVGIDPECRDLMNSCATGPLLQADPSEVRAALPLAGRVPRVRPVLQLRPGVTLTWANYLTLESALLAAVPAPAVLPSGVPPIVTGAAAAERPAADPLARLFDLARVLATDGAALAEGHGPAAPAIAPADLPEAFLSTLSTLAEGLAERRRELGEGDDAYVVAAEGLDGAIQGLGELARAWPRIVAPEHDPAIQALFALVARNFIHGHELGMCKTLTLGLARLGYQWLIGRGIAQARARSAKRVRPTVQDMLDGIVLARVLMRTQTGGHPVEPPAELLQALFCTDLPTLVAEPRRFVRRDSRVTVFMG